MDADTASVLLVRSASCWPFQTAPAEGVGSAFSPQAPGQAPDLSRPLQNISSLQRQVRSLCLISSPALGTGRLFSAGLGSARSPVGRQAQLWKEEENGLFLLILRSDPILSPNVSFCHDASRRVCLRPGLAPLDHRSVVKPSYGRRRKMVYS